MDLIYHEKEECPGCQQEYTVETLPKLDKEGIFLCESCQTELLATIQKGQKFISIKHCPSCKTEIEDLDDIVDEHLIQMGMPTLCPSCSQGVHIVSVEGEKYIATMDCPHCGKHIHPQKMLPPSCPCPHCNEILEIVEGKDKLNLLQAAPLEFRRMGNPFQEFYGGNPFWKGQEPNVHPQIAPPSQEQMPPPQQQQADVVSPPQPPTQPPDIPPIEEELFAEFPQPLFGYQEQKAPPQPPQDSFSNAPSLKKYEQLEKNILEIYPQFRVRHKHNSRLSLFLWSFVTIFIHTFFWFAGLFKKKQIKPPDFRKNYTLTLAKPTLWTPSLVHLSKKERKQKGWMSSSPTRRYLIVSHEFSYLDYVRQNNGILFWRIRHYSKMLFSQTYREQAILTGWKPNIEFWLLKGNGRISEIVCEEIVRLLTGPDYGYIFTEEQARSWLKLKVALCKKELIEEGRLETEEEKLIPFSEKQGKEPS